MESSPGPAAPREHPRILVIEDDPTVADLLARVLELADLRVLSVGTATAAREVIGEWRPDLIILDLILPDEDGLVLCTALRSMTRAPIVVCSGTRRRRDEFLSLKLGADDFIAKPFDIYDLTARVEAQLRRRPRAGAVATVDTTEPLRVGAVLIEAMEQRVTVGDRVIQLTPTEVRLLVVLARQPGRLVDREVLAQAVWGDLPLTSGRAVDVHIGRLRAKLAGPRDVMPSIISVRGFGYKLVPPHSAPEDDPADVPSSEKAQSVNDVSVL